MKRIDEDIIKLSKLSENKDKLRIGKVGSFERKLTEGVASREVLIESLTLKFKETLIFDDKIEVLVPENFKLMDEEFMNIKYPNNPGGGIVYTNEISSVDCVFSINKGTDVDEEEVPLIRDELVKLFRQVNYGAKFYEEGLDNFTGKDFAFFDFLVNRIYNFIAVTSFEGEIFMTSFSCSERDMKYWKPLFKGILRSIKFK